MNDNQKIKVSPVVVHDYTIYDKESAPNER